MDLSAIELCLTLTPGTEAGTCRLSAVWRRDGHEGPPVEATAALDAERWGAQYLRPLAEFVTAAPPAGLLETLGDELAAALFPQPVRGAVEDALANRDGSTGRLHLRLDARSAELAAIPWEFARLPELSSTGPHGGFLALHPGCSVVRGPASSRAAEPLAAEPLRVLFAWADPRSASYPRLAHLPEVLEGARAALRFPLCRQVELRELPSATPARLEDAIREYRPHVLHFHGHGDVRPTGGVLILQGDRPQTEAVLYADDLAHWLEGTPVSLVVLTACRTASHARARAAGAAQVLARNGLPAVVAMQLPLRDAAAGPFTGAFYTALFQSLSVEGALREGRAAVRDLGPDWGVPLLYLTPEHSRLFRIAPRPETPPAVTLPRTNLPYLRNPLFVGRERLLAELHQRLTAPGEPPAALVGMGGVGKTQIAVEYAHAYLEEYPGGIYWLNARDAVRLEEDYALLSRFFEVPDHLPVSERAARVRDCLQQLSQSSLLILDNLTEASSPRLPVGGRCRILATMRERHLAYPVFRVLDIPPLDDGAALSLLQAHREPTETEGGAARAIVEMLGNLPLGLALAGHLVQRLDLSYEECRRRLAENRVEVLRQARRRFITATGHDGGIWDALDLSYRSLTPAGQAVLAHAACFSGRGISQELLREACPPELQGEVEEALADLVGGSLAAREQDGRLTLHELVRVFARGSLSDEALRAAVDRVAAVLTCRLDKANRKMAWDDVRRELHHCRTEAALCRAHGTRRGCIDLLLELGNYALHHRELPAAEGYLRDGLSLARQEHGSDSLQAAVFLRKLAETLQRRERPGEALACAEAALRLASNSYSPDDAGLAEYHLCLGYVLKFQGRLADARASYEQALGILRRAHVAHHPDIASCLNNIGTLLEDEGALSTALEMMEEALEIDRKCFGTEHYAVAVRLNNIGRVLGQQGRWEEAAERHRAALAIHERLYGRRHLHAAWSLCYLGRALEAMEQRREALRHYLEALPVFEEHYGMEHFETCRLRQGLCLLGK